MQARFWQTKERYVYSLENRKNNRKINNVDNYFLCCDLSSSHKWKSWIDWNFLEKYTMHGSVILEVFRSVVFVLEKN